MKKITWTCDRCLTEIDSREVNLLTVTRCFSEVYAKELCSHCLEDLKRFLRVQT